MSARPPRRNTKEAPVFDGSKPNDLPRFFEDIELLGAEFNWDAAAQFSKAKYYASSDVAELWDTVSASATWEETKKSLIALYPSLIAGERYSKSDIERLVELWKERGFQTRDEFGEYKRDYLVHAKYLKDNSLITEEESETLFIKAFTGKLRDELRARLQIKEPDHDRRKPYKIADVLKSVDYVLGGSVFDELTSPTSSQSTTLVKKEDVDLSTVFETLKSFQVQLDAISRGASASRPIATGVPGTGSSPAPSTRSPGCSFCSELSHYIKSCPKVVEYMQAGKCMRNAEGYITLPNGNFIPRSFRGRNMMERIDNYYKDQVAHPVSIIELSSAPSPSLPGSASAMITEITSDDEEDCKIARLEVLLNEAKKRGAAAKKTKFEVVIPTEPSPRTKTAVAPPPKAAAPSKITPQTSPQRESPLKPTAQPQYRYVSPIEDASLIQKVLTRCLKSNVSVSQRELLALAPDLRKQMKELTTTKRYTIGDANLVSSSDPIPAYISTSETEPSTTLYGASKVKAQETLPLRTIKIVLEGVCEVEAILDQGAVVCLIREDIWERLGIALHPDQALILESVDSGKSSTLGMIHNLKVAIAGMELPLQVQVVRHVPFEALLGRPFFALTECETKDYRTGDQHITLTDPADRSRRCKVATGIRCLTRVFEEPDFQERQSRPPPGT